MRNKLLIALGCLLLFPPGFSAIDPNKGEVRLQDFSKHDDVYTKRR